jgi:hypothetical protein
MTRARDLAAFVSDANQDIRLDADGGDIRLLDGGTQFGKFTNSSSDFVISSSVNDKDIKFAGADGGADITALTLDMSAAGAATFNAGATFGSDVSITSGTNASLNVNDAVGEVGTGNLALQVTNSAGSALKPLGFRAENIRFATGSAERVRIIDDGLTFNGDTAAANALSDYEEGTWTADVSVGSVSNVSQATYTKIGNVVHVQCKLNSFSETSSSASLDITGIPFANFAADRSAIATSALSKNFSGQNDINAYFPTTTSVRLYGSITSGDFDNLRYSDLSSGMILYLGFSYLTA